mmetsp:Transcript_46316/g.122994  ORF Transcript_46316/g.122994 Transcript_46316/m.122994 type:complete len:204 (+) Transcript_46316:660-1271(+)
MHDIPKGKIHVLLATSNSTRIAVELYHSMQASTGGRAADHTDVVLVRSVNGHHPLQDARLPWKPRFQIRLCLLALKESLQNIEPPFISERPHGIHWKTEAIIHSVDKESPKFNFFQVRPRFLRKLVPNHQVLFVQISGEEEVEALRTVSDSAALFGHVNHIANEAVRRRVTKAVSRHHGSNTFLPFAFQDLDPTRCPRVHGGL